MATEITVGSGGDATDPYAAWLPYSGGTLTDDMIFTIISSCTLSGDMWGISYVSFDDYTVTWRVASGGEHGGVVGGGYVVTIPDNMCFNLNGNSLGGGTLNTTGLNFHCAGDGGSAGYQIRIAASNKTANISNCVIYLDDTAGDGALFLGPASLHTADYNISGCKFASEDTLTAPAIELINHTAGTLTMQNITAYNFGSPSSSNNAAIRVLANDGTIKNVIAASSNSSAIQYSTSGVTKTYCAASDESLPVDGTNVNNIVPANEFRSLDSSDADYLWLTALDVSGGIYEITKDYYFERSQPSNTEEIANVIEVPVQPLEVDDTDTRVYMSKEPITMAAGETQTVQIKYSLSKKQRGVLDATVTLETEEDSGVTPVGVNIDSVAYYSWGADVTLSATGSVTFVIRSDGKYLTVEGEETVEEQDADSIRAYGELRYELKENALIQKRALGEKIAETLLASYKLPRKDVEIEWCGDTALELGEDFEAPTYQKNGVDNRAIYKVTRNQISYDGSLRMKTKGRKLRNVSYTDDVYAAYQDTDSAPADYQDTDGQDTLWQDNDDY